MADPDLQLRRKSAVKGLTMNVEFALQRKCAISEKNKVGARAHRAPPSGPPLNNERCTLFYGRYTKELSFPEKLVYNIVNAWTSGRSLRK